MVGIQLMTTTTAVIWESSCVQVGRCWRQWPRPWKKQQWCWSASLRSTRRAPTAGLVRVLSCSSGRKCTCWDFCVVYLVVIRPVLEYAAAVWHHLLTKTQSDQLEVIPKMAVRIICQCECVMASPVRMCCIWLNSLVSQAEARNYVDASSAQLHNPIPAYTLASHLNEILQ